MKARFDLTVLEDRCNPSDLSGACGHHHHHEGHMKARLDCTALEDRCNPSAPDLSAATLDLSGATGPIFVDLTGSDGTGYQGYYTVSAGPRTAFSGVGNIVGSPYVDEIQGRDVNSTWTVSATGETYNDGTETLTFSGFEVLTGGGAADQFVFSGDQAKTPGMTVNGGVGTDTIDLSDASNTGSTFNFSTTNAGSVSGGISFTSVENYNGTGGDDTFVLANGVNVSGHLNGGGGVNTLDYSNWTTAVTVNLDSNLSTGIVGGISNFDNATGGSGNDTLIGNADNNVLIGNAGADIIVGRDGNDTLFGGDGRDILIGDGGNDVIDGGNDDDILIGGTTTYTNASMNIAGLNSIRSEWNSSASYSTRVGCLEGTVPRGLNGSNYLKPGITVLDDGNADTLTGDAGQDYFFVGTGDSDDAVTGEVVRNV